MMEESKPTYCSAVGRRWLIYEETNQSDGRFQVVTVQAFLEWMICLRNAEPKGKPKLILLVYNFQGFNGFFVLNHLYRKDMSPQQIVNGAMKTPVFGIDPAQNQIHRQLEPFPMPLADFLKAFCLQEEAKRFIPHFLDRPEHQTYVGPLPNKHYYDPDGRSQKRRDAFSRWYDSYHPQASCILKQIQFCKQEQTYKKEGPDPHKGSNQLYLEKQNKKARLILKSGIYISFTNISEGTAFLLQGLM